MSRLYTAVLTSVPAKLTTSTDLRVWCDHCASSSTATRDLLRHYREHHAAHTGEKPGWVFETYAQSRHGLSVGLPFPAPAPANVPTATYMPAVVPMPSHVPADHPFSTAVPVNAAVSVLAVVPVAAGAGMSVGAGVVLADEDDSDESDASKGERGGDVEITVGCATVEEESDGSDNSGNGDEGSERDGDIEMEEDTAVEEVRGFNDFGTMGGDKSDKAREDTGNNWSSSNSSSGDNEEESEEEFRKRQIEKQKLHFAIAQKHLEAAAEHARLAVECQTKGR